MRHQSGLVRDTLADDSNGYSFYQIDILSGLKTSVLIYQSILGRMAPEFFYPLILVTDLFLGHHFTT
jgi:hypothetical protein